MKNTLEDRLFKLFGWSSLLVLVIALIDIIIGVRIYGESFTVWRILKLAWAPNLFALIVCLLTTVLPFFRERWCVFLPLLIIYPRGYNALILIGNVTLGGIDFWLSYAVIISRLIYFFIALVLIIRYLARLNPLK